MSTTNKKSEISGNRLIGERIYDTCQRTDDCLFHINLSTQVEIKTFFFSCDIILCTSNFCRDKKFILYGFDGGVFISHDSLVMRDNYKIIFSQKKI